MLVCVVCFWNLLYKYNHLIKNFGIFFEFLALRFAMRFMHCGRVDTSVVASPIASPATPHPLSYTFKYIARIFLIVLSFWVKCMKLSVVYELRGIIEFKTYLTQ